MKVALRSFGLETSTVAYGRPAVAQLISFAVPSRVAPPSPLPEGVAVGRWVRR
ncbi:hypothetical protein ACE1SV_27810 [Streptomyces sp. E-15]